MDRENFYSIGEVAKILGISVQSLRYYNKIELLKPAYINPETGYRYYTYIQLSLIDRIRYLETIGLSLTEIKNAFTTGTSKALLPYLEKQLKGKMEEQQKIQETVDILKWYINFFCYSNRQQFQAVPYRRMIGERYMLAVSSLPEEQNIQNSNQPSKASLLLKGLKADKKFKDVAFLRQNGNIISFKCMLEEKWVAQKYFVYLKGDPGFQDPNIIRIPAGEYLCFQGRPLINDWNTTYIRKLFETVPEGEFPTLVVANEYEENFTSFIESLYEIQILIWQSDYHHQEKFPFFDKFPV
nr:helix-turn-helix domain-containing protein [uncultured Caproiciproducens sp.]